MKNDSKKSGAYEMLYNQLLLSYKNGITDFSNLLVAAFQSFEDESGETAALQIKHIIQFVETAREKSIENSKNNPTQVRH